MKSVSFSEVVYASDSARAQHAAPARKLWPFWLLLGSGLAAIVALMRLFDPAAPLGWIVLPVLAGGLLPVWALMPARFEVNTRFEARHLVGAIEEALLAQGYARAVSGPDALLYRKRVRWLSGPAREVNVSLRPHMLGIAGPAIALRRLQRALSG